MQNFRITQKLGEGHYSVVQLGVNKKTGESVAIKCVQKGNTSFSLFSNEVELMQEVGSHPNFVKYKDFFIDKAYYILVMEFISGGDLYSNVSKVVAFSEDKIAHLVLQVVKAISYLHSRKIVHRDIKPENILFVDQDLTMIKLCDFGIAKKLPKKGYLNERIGTEGYMAPEVEAGKSYTLSADMYSLGLVIYFMICGYSVFEPENGVVDIEFPIENWSNISSSIKDLITNLLDKIPNKRPTAEELLKHSWVSQKPGKKRKLSEINDNISPVLPKKKKTVPPVSEVNSNTSPSLSNKTETAASEITEKIPSELPSLPNQTITTISEINDNIPSVLPKKKPAPPKCSPQITLSYSAMFKQIGLDGVNLKYL